MERAKALKRLANVAKKYDCINLGSQCGRYYCLCFNDETPNNPTLLYFIGMEGTGTTSVNRLHTETLETIVRDLRGM